MIKIICRILGACILLLCVHSYGFINYYQSVFIRGFTKDGQLKIAIRYFQKDGQPFFLIVDPYQYKTKIVPANEIGSSYPLTAAEKHPKFGWNVIKNTPYMKSLFYYTNYSGNIQNSGIIHAANSPQGFFLTADLCPSGKLFEKDFFNKLVQMSDVAKKPFPIAIAISGVWLIDHKNEFDWLVKMQNEGKLAITWMNHSFSHVYFADLPDDRNFMLFQFTNFENEVYATEIALIQQGQVPSIFFRFPGLVADRKLLEKIKNVGLIPVGTDAWLAEGQKPKDGSIILVHGNGNEHIGIIDVMPYLNQFPVSHWYPICSALPK